jgi:hypothetical protein
MWPENPARQSHAQAPPHHHNNKQQAHHQPSLGQFGVGLVMSWLSHFTGTKNKNTDSGRSPDRSTTTSPSPPPSDSNKKKKLSDAMEEEIDEGTFFWVGTDDDRAVPKPPAFSLAASSYPFSLSSSSSSSSSPSSMPAGPPSSHNSSRSAGEEVLPPYRRPTAGTTSAAAAEPLYPRIGISSLSLAAGPGSTPQSSAAGTATQRTPAHAPLQGCSFRLNPRLVALATPSPPVQLPHFPTVHRFSLFEVLKLSLSLFLSGSLS